ncbi:Uncharacterized protein dnl_64320 [Desulfonema limicola]|uniref:Uncharacterized protein n=1 Tax=Desulfonema limicola TaxID=45656 RepID=A0A975BEK3_9BACT|nr:hypothetical protein [Desulfonema limicola]QTA84001.1 Uncharacterized protein dnl_64320 [Desulfonema limicola]
MSIDLFEYENEAFWDENREIIIEDFTSEKLESYYQENKLLVKPSFGALNRAKKFINSDYSDYTVAFIFASISIEVGWKSALIKPTVYGLVHTESFASLIMDLIMAHHYYEKFQKIFFAILNKYGDIDLTCYKRNDSNKPLWEEIKIIQKKRNDVVHKAENVNKSDAELAISVASEILEKIIPKFLNCLDLKLDENTKMLTRIMR